MKGFWSLPQAAPILVRHLTAYAELFYQDLDEAQQNFRGKVIAVVVIAHAALFAMLMICAAIVAAYWDTPQRMQALYWMIAFFVLVACIALGYLLRMARAQPRPFDALRKEWAIDRDMIAELVAEKEADDDSES
jgi:uncharacterized membrane protein YqjE